jgi:hypothetical protein
MFIIPVGYSRGTDANTRAQRALTYTTLVLDSLGAMEVTAQYRSAIIPEHGSFIFTEHRFAILYCRAT